MRAPSPPFPSGSPIPSESDGRAFLLMRLSMPENGHPHHPGTMGYPCHLDRSGHAGRARHAGRPLRIPATSLFDCKSGLMPREPFRLRNRVNVRGPFDCKSGLMPRTPLRLRNRVNVARPFDCDDGLMLREPLRLQKWVNATDLFDCDAGLMLTRRDLLPKRVEPRGFRR
jgi:hypothetical protein